VTAVVSRELRAEAIKTFSVGQETVYITGAEGAIRAIDANAGNERWSTPIASIVDLPDIFTEVYTIVPAFEHQDVVWLIGLVDGGALVQLDRSNGSKLGSFYVPAEAGSPRSMLSIQDGLISFRVK